MKSEMTKEDVSAILDSVGKWDNVPYTVESDRVWISGSYANGTLVARQMTEHLVYEEDIPCGLPYQDPSDGRYSGVAFNWYDPAELKDVTVWVEDDYAGSGPGEWKEVNPSAEELFSTDERGVDLEGERNE